jgi:hypothetical protein
LSSSSAPEAAQRRAGVARRGWLADAIIAGFVATGASTGALVLAYLAAAVLGSENGNLLSQWMYDLTHNPIVSFSQASPGLALVLHVAFGVVWAFLFAAVFEPRVGRNMPTWLAGMVWGLLVGMLSLFIFLPIAGAGVLGVGLGAGPLPIVGNLLLHMVYGWTLGKVYDPEEDTVSTDEGAYREEMDVDEAAIVHSEEFGAAGIVAGLGLGALVGAVLAAILPPASGEAVSGWGFALAAGGVLAGGAVGAVVGSFAGLPQTPHDPAEAALGPDPFERNWLPMVIVPCVVLAVIALIVSIGSTLLTAHEVTRDKMIPVWVALAVTTVIGVGGTLISLNQESRSRRDGARRSQTGH